ncbi:MAG: hypothetical protein U0984_04335 [Prosthecobacter sp.]|nr:hypothetical protein [Prosthecobacter sp.]
MNALLAFPVWLRRPDFGHHVEDTAAMDWFVLATLGFLFFLLGCFATWAWLLWRRSHRPTPQVKLLMELEEEERQTETKRPPAEPAEPWERPADWWKK